MVPYPLDITQTIKSSTSMHQNEEEVNQLQDAEITYKNEIEMQY